MSHPVPLVLFGVPGAGKGTLAQILVSHFGFAHLSTGAAMRAWAEGPSPEQHALKAGLARGEYGSDGLAARIVAETISGLPTSTPAVILDGFPRTVAQLEAWLASGARGIGVYLALDPAVAAARIARRGTCAIDGSTVPSAGMPCPTCTRPTSRRSDDMDSATVARRMSTYEATVEPVIAIWQARGLPLFTIDNGGSIAALAPAANRLGNAVQAGRRAA